MSGSEAPVTVNWSTIFAFLALLFTGFAAWLFMNQRVVALENNMAPNMREDIAVLKLQNSQLQQRLAQIEARASGSPPA